MDPKNYLEILDSEDDNDESSKQEFKESNEKSQENKIQCLIKASNEKIKDKTTLTTTIEPVQPGEHQNGENPSVSGSSLVPQDNPLFAHYQEPDSELGSGLDQGHDQDKDQNQVSEQVSKNQNKNPSNGQPVKRSTVTPNDENFIQEPEESNNSGGSRTERIWSSFSRFLGRDPVGSEEDENSRSNDSQFSISSSPSSSNSSVIELVDGSSNESKFSEVIEVDPLSSTSSVVVPIGSKESLDSVKKVLDIPKYVPEVQLEIDKFRSSLTEKLTKPAEAIPSACAIANFQNSTDNVKESDDFEKLTSSSTTNDEAHAQQKDLEVSKGAQEEQVQEQEQVLDSNLKSTELKDEPNATAHVQQVEDSKSLSTNSSSSTSSTSSFLETYPDPSITLLSRALFTASSANIKYQDEFICVRVTKLLDQQPPTGESVFTVSTRKIQEANNYNFPNEIQMSNEKLHQSLDSIESINESGSGFFLPIREPKSILRENSPKKVRGRPRKSVSFSSKVPKPRPRFTSLVRVPYEATLNNNPLDLSPSSSFFLSTNPIGTNSSKSAHAQNNKPQKQTRSTSVKVKQEPKISGQNSGSAKPKDLSSSKKRKRASPETKDLEQPIIKKRYNLRN